MTLLQKKLDSLCEPVTPHVWILPGEDEGRFPFCHSFLFTGDRNILLDPGCGLDRLKAVQELVSIDMVVLSHTHPDHISGAWLFEGVPILCPRETPTSISDLDSLAVRFTGGGKAAEQWKGFVTSAMGLRMPSPTARFSGGDLVVEGSAVRLRALYAPGHTVDHYVFFEEVSGLLLSSDIDLTPFGPWYGHAECSLPAFRSSLRMIRSLSVRAILSSHRGVIRDGITEEIDLFEKGFDRHKEALRQRLQSGSPLSLEQLVELSPIYQADFPEALFMRNFESWMLRHLLAGMIEEGEVSVQAVSVPGRNDPEQLYSLAEK